MQSLLLHKYGLTYGHGVGLLTVDYIFHKSSILLYASVMLLFQGAWLGEACPDLSRYLLLGYVVCGAVAAISCQCPRNTRNAAVSTAARASSPPAIFFHPFFIATLVSSRGPG